ncbi:MAG: NAD(P)/FAD-dependent oxidoreductase [Bacteroidetes bacterium]|nr:NAD(P)/FAD-dependent oxidoreductase [Bacteroidota bacterium]
MNSFDAGIIGGGLAGLTLSIQLAKTGHSVVLFETHTYPFHKVCGEYISMESWPFLQRLGVPLDDLHLPRITQFRISSPKGSLFSTQLKPGGFGISRYTLDHLLAGIAREAGVLVLDGTKVDSVSWTGSGHEISAGNKSYSVKIAAGTYGKRSNLDRNLNRDFFLNPKPALSEWMGIKYHVQSDIPENQIELHNFEDGYCGISRVDLGRTCMCYLVRSKKLKEAGGDVNVLEEAVLMRNPFLRDYFYKYPSLYESPKAISQINFQKKSAIENHILMAGDAAGLIPPLSGNGMSMAMNASAMLAPLASDFLTGKLDRESLEKSYTTQWEQKFSSRIRSGRLIQSWFGNPVLTEVLIGSAKVIPGLAKGLISLTHGKEF